MNIFAVGALSPWPQMTIKNTQSLERAGYAEPRAEHKLKIAASAVEGLDAEN